MATDQWFRRVMRYIGPVGEAKLGMLTAAIDYNETEKVLYCGFHKTRAGEHFHKPSAAGVAELRLDHLRTGVWEFDKYRKKIESSWKAGIHYKGECRGFIPEDFDDEGFAARIELVTPTAAQHPIAYADVSILMHIGNPDSAFLPSWKRYAQFCFAGSMHAAAHMLPQDELESACSYIDAVVGDEVRG